MKLSHAGTNKRAKTEQQVQEQQGGIPVSTTSAAYSSKNLEQQAKADNHIPNKVTRLNHKDKVGFLENKFHRKTQKYSAMVLAIATT